jgi:restriction system protein
LGNTTHTTDIGRAVHLEVWVCQACGWWSIGHHYAFEIVEPDLSPNDYYTHYGAGYAHGSLKNLDPSDVEQPVEEITRYLVAKSEAIGFLRPRLVEEVVASVFRNLGYSVLLTPLVGDDGIDIYLVNDQGGKEVAIQVKRWNKSISVEPIRAFLGALMLQGLTRGIMVATSRFTMGAERTATNSRDLGLATIELKDGAWIVDTLKITQRACYEGLEDPSAPFYVLLKNPHLIPAWDFYQQFE